MQSDGTVRAVRLLFIIVALMRAPRRTIDLARRFRVTRRCIEKDMRILGHELHAPIYYERGQWYLLEGWEMVELLNPVMEPEKTN
jgi:predicted DNA-binding transcriptional regulator YafY